ncbi:hypothetical protein PtA15_1A425 [Puccinia triticina]|uniref:Uncharacterized protein n=1 Tax=Puccinia triticina TaxID=208348 RepID=A0ABY7CE31_9BASI|nr:uncharacterized protein PtA15_1A425 [Puccinia triticina]WAQ81087.1 hypothetical protein PtA15_1A425 [Puccinia triticina]
MSHNTPMSLLLLSESDFMSVSEGSQSPRTRLGSKTSLPATPLKPSVLRTATVKSIIQRNHYRHAKDTNPYPLLATTGSIPRSRKTESLSMVQTIYPPTFTTLRAIVQELVAILLKQLILNNHSGTSSTSPPELFNIGLNN